MSSKSRGFFRVVEEQFVEVAHAVEDQQAPDAAP
jgi:hypothetical protein